MYGTSYREYYHFAIKSECYKCSITSKAFLIDFFIRCLNKIESFLMTLSYRLYNRFVGNRLETLNTVRQMRRQEFLDSEIYTNVPYFSAIDSYKFIDLQSWEPTVKIYNCKEWDFAQEFTKRLNANERSKNDQRLSSE